MPSKQKKYISESSSSDSESYSDSHSDSYSSLYDPDADPEFDSSPFDPDTYDKNELVPEYKYDTKKLVNLARGKMYYMWKISRKYV